jgi:hypothetical protein
MQEMYLFEYSVIRIVPRVEREEFLNAGVILYCPDKCFLQTISELNEKRLSSFFSEINIEELKERLGAFDRICKGLSDSGPIGKLATASRFRWLTATRSTILQTSPVHSGLCKDPSETLNRLFLQLIS